MSCTLRIYHSYIECYNTNYYWFTYLLSFDEFIVQVVNFNYYMKDEGQEERQGKPAQNLVLSDISELSLSEHTRCSQQPAASSQHTTALRHYGHTIMLICS